MVWKLLKRLNATHIFLVLPGDFSVILHHSEQTLEFSTYHKNCSKLFSNFVCHTRLSELVFFQVSNSQGAIINIVVVRFRPY